MVFARNEFKIEPFHCDLDLIAYRIQTRLSLTPSLISRWTLRVCRSPTFMSPILAHFHTNIITSGSYRSDLWSASCTKCPSVASLNTRVTIPVFTCYDTCPHVKSLSLTLQLMVTSYQVHFKLIPFLVPYIAAPIFWIHWTFSYL